jgi:hypothetical protein
MSNQHDDPSTKRIPLKDLHTEPGADALVESPAMRPYVNFAMAMMQQHDLGPAKKEIAALPLEAPYVWRVASALKWAFADLETLYVEVDRETILKEDRQRIIDLLKNRPLQFCLFLSALFGQKQMELMIVSALKNARTVAAHSEGEQR